MQMIVVPYSPASMKADFGGWQFQSRFQMGFNEEFLHRNERKARKGFAKGISQISIFTTI
ncbi:hypothetical protein [Paraflavitalea sp. sgz302552]|uniref:hypothetical protein n=1 Tax=Paraflavitalea sp. sgz302552 TaxID=3423908 RepID=UPI003D34D26C